MAYSAYGAASQVFPDSPLATAAAATRKPVLASQPIQPAGGNTAASPTPPAAASSTPPSSSTSNNAPSTTAAPAPSTAGYDINSDPVYQQAKAWEAAANSQAQAQALSQEQQDLLDYGSGSLASSVLGASDPFVQAAAQNQESTLAQLGRQYQNELQQFNETIDPSLVDSGYRVLQERNMGSSYQDQLAQAAQAIQQQLQGIQATLSSTEATNANTLIGAAGDAYSRLQAQALANPPASTTPPPAPVVVANPYPVMVPM